MFFEKITKYLAIPKVAADKALRTEALHHQPMIENEITQIGNTSSFIYNYDIIGDF
jgi:hypothetical protein